MGLLVVAQPVSRDIARRTNPTEAVFRFMAGMIKDQERREKRLGGRAQHAATNAAPLGAVCPSF
jgi:hypothetical protein